MMPAEARRLMDVMDVALGRTSDLLRATIEMLCPERPTGTVWEEVGDDLRQAMRDYPLSAAARDAEARTQR